MKYPVTLDALEVLDAIARKGSFAAAAADLFKVPSAVSYTVQKLEQDLEIVLFRKQGRKSVLTEAGKVMLEQGRELLEASQRLAVAVKKTHHGWEPVFNIAIDSILSFDFIYPVLAQFYQIHPDIEINLFEEVLGGAHESIRVGRADLVVGAGLDPVLGAGLRYQVLREIEWIFAVAPEHPLTREPLPLTTAAIEQYRFIAGKDTSRNQAPQSRRMLSKRPALGVPSITEKVRAQSLGLGVGFLPAHRIQHELEQGLLIALPVAGVQTLETIHMAWKTGNKGKVLHWFIEQLGKLHF